MKTTLIIATYNWPQALELVLLSVLRQTCLPNQIIIADDGSTQTTQQLAKQYSNKFNPKLIHIWQENNGFQKTKILNKAVAKAKGDYIIQIDGDIILHEDFVNDHIKAAKKNTFIHGSRVFINQAGTKKVLNNLPFQFSLFNPLLSNRLNGIRSEFLSKIMSKRNKSLKGTRGCNFSFWKQDFLLANGYNEDMVGWGKEDTELSARFINLGMKKNNLKCLAICYHLHHKILSKEGLNVNTKILSKTITENKKSCTNGINNYVN